MPDKCIERSHEAGMLQEWAESCNPAALSKLIDLESFDFSQRNGIPHAHLGDTSNRTKPISQFFSTEERKEQAPDDLRRITVTITSLSVTRDTTKHAKMHS